MKRLLAVLILLLATASVASAHTYVFKTGSPITIDGNLSDWINASVLSWRSPHSSVEYNFIYVTHDDSNYYLGMKVYDDDNVNEDDIAVYFNTSNGTYKLVLEEGSNTLNAYRYDNGSWVSVAANYSLVYTTSLINNPYSYVELKLSKNFLNYSHEVRFYLEYASTHVEPVYGWYPSDANFNNVSTWEVLRFVEKANRTLTLNISDRDGYPINYSDDYLVEAYYTSNMSKIVSVIGREVTTLLLPPENVTIVVKYLAVPVFEKVYNLTLGNISDSVKINNILRVDTPEGYLVISVEKNGTLKSVDFDYSRGRAIILSNSSEIFLDSKAGWNFLAVLYAESYEYNPVTGHLLVRLNGTKDVGLVLVVGDVYHPVLKSASNTVRFVSFDYEKGVYTFDVLPGEYVLSSSDPPFCVALNDTALKRNVDYSTSSNETVINVTKNGLLDVYFKNPTSVSVQKFGNEFKVFVATPYDFTGKVHYVVKKAGKTIEDKTLSFRATAPLTVVTVKPSVSGDVQITVYDVDSGKELYRVTEKLLYTNYTIIGASLLLVIGVVAALIVYLRKGKHKALAKMEKEFKFFRKV